MHKASSPEALPLGELARMRLRGQGCCQRARHTAIRTLLVRAIVSQRFRVSFCWACPLRLLRRHLSQRERLWQSAKSAVTARGSPFGRAGANAPERARMLPKSQTHSDTHPACQSHRIATLSCFILLGLPSPSASQTPLPKGEALAVRKVCCYRQRLSLDKLVRR